MSSVYNLNNVQWKSGSLNQEIPVLKRNNRDTLSAGQSYFAPSHHVYIVKN